jgi:hypothetical protein
MTGFSIVQPKVAPDRSISVVKAHATAGDDHRDSLSPAVFCNEMVFNNVALDEVVQCVLRIRAGIELLPEDREEPRAAFSRAKFPCFTHEIVRANQKDRLVGVRHFENQLRKTEKSIHYDRSVSRDPNKIIEGVGKLGS